MPASVGASPDDEEDVDGETDPEDDEAVHDADAGLANVDLDPRLAKHLRDEHDIHSLAEYRREVFGRVVAGWPQTIPPQVVRARLHAWKNWFTDDRFAYGVCASCARRVSAHDLVDAVFPDLADPDTPDWLGWKPSEWQQHRELWYQRMDALLCVQSYLTTYFEAPKKMQEAQRELRLAQDELEQAASETAEAKVEAAKIWLSRVEQWAEYMSQDLKSDAVLSPGGSLWLLYAPACRNGRSGPLCCRLCSICAAAFRKRNARGAPSPELPYCCRARGLWGGPEPVEISRLSWVSRRIVNLARVYVSVKRVMRKDAPWASRDERALPQYTTRNVVCYPQDPDAALKTVCVVPEDLVQILTVQFVGCDPRVVLSREPSLE